MLALDLIKEQLKSSREIFEGTVGDLKEDQIHKDPGGKALPIGSVYVHCITSEDMAIQSILQGKPTILESEYKDNLFIDLPIPPMDENWSEANGKWAKQVKVNLSKLREYSKLVYVSTDNYINNLKDGDLDKDIDMGSWGGMSVSSVLTNFIIGHSYSLAGEISALKGIQNLKGYPF